MTARNKYEKAAFIEIIAEESPNGVPFCWDVTEQKVIFGRDSVNPEYFNLFVSSPVLFQTLSLLSARLSNLNEVLLKNGVDVSDEIDYLINSAIDAQRIATDGLSEVANRTANEKRKFK